MRNKSKVIRYLSLSLAAVVFVLIGGSLNEAKAQCGGDPFCTPSWKKTNTNKPATTTPGQKDPNKPEKKTPPAIIPVAAPPIEQRIAYYKQQREIAAANGLPLPKVTSVMTLSELSVTGIFRTPRGYAAMVEAVPIKLSYTIYPGEKFFDGQLVAIEDNRVIFRKVTKMSNNKFITSVENKALRQYTVQEEIQGTVPTQTAPTGGGSTEVVNNSQPTTQPQTSNSTQTTSPGVIVSPVDEMNRQPEEKPKDAVKERKPKKPAKSTKKS